MLSTVGLAMTFSMNTSPGVTDKRSILLGPSVMSINDRTPRTTSASDGLLYHKADQPFNASQVPPRTRHPDSSHWSRHVSEQSNVVVGGRDNDPQPSESHASGTTSGIDQYVVHQGEMTSTTSASDKSTIGSLVETSREPSQSNGHEDSEASCTESGSQDIDAANILLQIQRSPPIDFSELPGHNHIEVPVPPIARCRTASVLVLPTMADSKKKGHKKPKSSSASKLSTIQANNRAKNTSGETNTTAANTKKRRASTMQRSVETSPTVPKRIKKLSNEAQVGKEWCNKIKQMDSASLPFFCPPRSKFRGAIPTASTSEKYVAARGASYEVNPKHPTLSSNEQRFVAAFGGRFSEEQYIDCKKRIFVCHRWRTEEDGLTHNIESSQQVCSVDVKVSTTIHKWFDSMHMFHQRWETADKTSRPPYMIRLQRATFGRNGRESATKVLNVLTDL